MNKLVFYTSWEEQCGIAVYTQNLMRALQQADRKLNISVHSSIAPLKKTEEALVGEPPNVFHIQYEVPIMPHASLLKLFLQRLQDRGCKIVVTFHSSEAYQDYLLHVGAGVADLLLLHRNPFGFQDERLKVLGEIGVPVVKLKDREWLRKTYGFAKEDKLLSTFGFMLHWKRHAEILATLVSHLKRNPSLKVQLLTSRNTLSGDESPAVEEAIKKVIRNSGVAGQIVHVTDWLPSEEIVQRLHMSDLGWLYADQDTTSLSAAAREFVAARLPLAVTHSTHFSGLDGSVAKLPMWFEHFARDLVALLGNEEKLKRLKQRQKQLIAATNYNSFAAKHLELYSQL